MAEDTRKVCRHCRDTLVMVDGGAIGGFWIHRHNRAVACAWGPTFRGSLYGHNADPVDAEDPSPDESGAA